MSDPDPTVTPEQEARLRRLLAEARHDEPAPGDVAARLDRVLAELGRADERLDTPDHDPDDTGHDTGRDSGHDSGHGAEATPSAADVVALARRRRRAATLLVAAALVVLAGVGLTHLPHLGGGSSDSAAESAGSAVAAAPDESRTTSPDRTRADGTRAGESVSGPGGVTLHARSFSRQVSRLSRLDVRPGAPSGTSSGTGAGTSSGPSSGTGGSTGTGLGSCRGRFGPGRRVPASYDGVRAVLVFRPATPDSQVVELLRCGTAEVLRSTTLAR